MARRTAEVTIDDPGDPAKSKPASRDHGKVYVLTEMAAADADRWAQRVFFEMIKGGVDLPDGVASTGMAGIAAVGLRGLAGIDSEKAIKLLDEMLACVKIRPDPSNPAVVRPLMAAEDTEEVKTRLLLRMEVFKLHTGFSIADALSKSTPGTTSAGS